MHKEPRTERQAHTLLISSLHMREQSVKIGSDFARPAPKREKKREAKANLFARFFGKKG